MQEISRRWVIVSISETYFPQHLVKSNGKSKDTVNLILASPNRIKMQTSTQNWHHLKAHQSTNNFWNPDKKDIRKKTDEFEEYQLTSKPYANIVLGKKPKLISEWVRNLSNAANRQRRGWLILMHLWDLLVLNSWLTVEWQIKNTFNLIPISPDDLKMQTLTKNWHRQETDGRINSQFRNPDKKRS